MSMRGDYESVTAGQVSPVAVAGVVIRYAFYAIGALVLGVIGLSVLSLWNVVPKKIDAQPAFHIASGEFAGKPTNGSVVTSSHFGRYEMLQYGELNNRNSDLAIVMVLPPAPGGVRLVQDLTDLNLLQLKRPRIMSQVHYDLDTRFGEFRATEMRVDTDGRWKQCLSYRSRFNNSAVVITGWYCDGSGSKPSPHALACSLDKMVLDQELAVKGADNYLRERMGKAARCRADSVTQTTDMGNRGMSPPSRWSQPSATYRRY
jgi:hypothetical protein